MQTLKLVLFSFALVVVPWVSAAQQRQAEDRSRDMGKQEYFGSCASCHGPKGKGVISANCAALLTQINAHWQMANEMRSWKSSEEKRTSKRV